MFHNFQGGILLVLKFNTDEKALKDSIFVQTLHIVKDKTKSGINPFKQGILAFHLSHTSVLQLFQVIFSPSI